jgi:hypothetical protein
MSSGPESQISPSALVGARGEGLADDEAVERLCLLARVLSEIRVTWVLPRCCVTDIAYQSKSGSVRIALSCKQRGRSRWNRLNRP